MNDRREDALTEATTEIGIGIVGGGYMGKAHSVAMSAVGAVFNTKLRPRLEMIAASTPESAEKYRSAYGFARATHNWKELVRDSRVEAIVIASPQDTHHDIAMAAFALGMMLFLVTLGINILAIRIVHKFREAYD